MSTIDPDMINLLEAFIAESTSLLEELDEIMLESEKSKSISEKNINEIFRVMHTIKGSAAMMGLSDLSNLAHSVEDVFFIIRQDPAKLDIVIDSIFDLLFQSVDYIKGELDAIQGEDEGEHQDPSELMARLEREVARMNGEAPPAPVPERWAPQVEEPAPTATETAEPQQEKPLESEETHLVRVFFEDGCQMENIRAFMLLSQLKDWCDEISSVPANPEGDASLAADIIKNGFLIRFKTTGDPAQVLKVIEDSVNIKSYEVEDEETATVVKKVVIPASDDAQPSSSPSAADDGNEAAAEPAKKDTGAQMLPKIAKQNLISVNQSKLDQLMDLVGEIVTAESMVASNPDLKGLQLDNFYKSTRELRKLTDELQDVVMSIRMVPLNGVFSKMNRIVRDMGKKLGKEVELVTVGGDTEVDKTINDSLSDPFMHMIRNSVDHAIESPEVRRSLGKPEVGRVTLSAQNIGGEIVITIADDGCGLDPVKLMQKARDNNLLVKPEADYSEREIYGFIMLPGFSTNREVTEYSGRGVGMDVVRKNIEKVGGSISISSAINVGTTFTIKIPLTLAIVDGMELLVGSTIFTLPITSIKQSFKISEEEQIIYNTDGSEMIMLRGECYPLIRLHRLYGIETQVTDLQEGIVIQVEYGEKVGCIFADELVGEQQVVVKPFPTFLNRYNIKNCGLSGCTILGDGSISLILDANSLLSYSER